MKEFLKINKERYACQTLFSPIGKDGQEKLLNSKVAIIGCGGLGSVIANNLVRAGIGFLKIVDMDRVDITNLQRQILYEEEDLNRDSAKVKIAAEKLKKINSAINIEAINTLVSADNINDIIKDMDIVLDGTDNFKIRFIINEACVFQKIPWIFGSVAASYGMIFNIFPDKTPCFNCIFSDITENSYAEKSENVGILNTAVNIIASIQTTEALKYLTGNHGVLIKDLVFIDLWNLSLKKIEVKKNDKIKCTVCDPKPMSHTSNRQHN